MGIKPSDSWISADTITGEIGPGEGRAIRVQTDRSALAFRTNPYTGSLTIESNGGAVSLPISVLQRENTPLISIEPDTLHFDTSKTSLTLTIKNTGTAAMARCSLSTTQPWIDMQPAVVNALAAGASVPVAISVDRSHAQMQLGWNFGGVTLLSDGGNTVAACDPLQERYRSSSRVCAFPDRGYRNHSLAFLDKKPHSEFSSYKVYRSSDSLVNLGASRCIKRPVPPTRPGPMRNWHPSRHIITGWWWRRRKTSRQLLKYA